MHGLLARNSKIGQNERIPDFLVPQAVLALRGPGGVGESSGLLPRFHAGAPPPGKRLAASPWAARAGGVRLKWAKGRSGSKIDEKVKVLRMSLPIVENLSGLQESIFSLSRSHQLHFG